MLDSTPLWSLFILIGSSIISQLISLILVNGDFFSVSKYQPISPFFNGESGRKLTNWFSLVFSR